MAGTQPESQLARGSRFCDSAQNLLRITSVRIITQTLMFALFLTFMLLTTFGNLDRWPGLRHWLGKFLEIDPLIALATAITTHTVYKGLLWSLILLVPTFFLGRFFCNWICPYGSLHQFVGWLLRTRRAADRKGRWLEAEASGNAYQPAQRVKYYLLAGLLAAALFGILQIGLLDPLCLLYRSFTAAVLPALGMPAPKLFGPQRFHQGAWLIGFLLFGLLAMNLVYPRFFCRVLCPLGALLGLLSRFSWWRITRDPEKCRGCTRCLLHCEGACDPHNRLRKAECFVCFNCIEECPEKALSFRWLPPREGASPGPDVQRRKVVFGGVVGALFYPFVRGTGRSTRDFSSQVIRPPGAVEELEFLARCVKCDQCVRVCPTNVIQPDWFESGLEGLWTPVLNFRMGYCQLHCTACGHVCPSGAIQRISVTRKLGLDSFADQGPIRLGTAYIDVSRCLPYSANIPCQVCEEVCPVSPKAIQTRRRRQGAGRGRGGGNLGVSAETAEPPPVPSVNVDLCIGCGICEYSCPVVGNRRAIYVTADGETRSRQHPDPHRNRSVHLRSPGR